MDQKVLKVDDLNPDGLRVTVNWDDMVLSRLYLSHVSIPKRLKINYKSSQNVKNGSLTCRSALKTKN